LAEKEVQLQEARVVTTQQMNSHEDTKRDGHNVANNLMQTQHDLENESAVRANFEATAQNLTDKLKFDADVHQKVGNSLSQHAGYTDCKISCWVNLVKVMLI
jgi:hypothetical protein